MIIGCALARVWAQCVQRGQKVCDLCMKYAFSLSVYAVCTVYAQSVNKVLTQRDESAYKGSIQCAQSKFATGLPERSNC